MTALYNIARGEYNLVAELKNPNFMAKLTGLFLL